MVEGLDDVGAALVAYRDLAEACEPSVTALHHPSASGRSTPEGTGAVRLRRAVPTEALAALDPASRDTGNDAPVPVRPPATGEVVAPVGVQLGRTSPAHGRHRRHGIEHRLEHAA